MTTWEAAQGHERAFWAARLEKYGLDHYHRALDCESHQGMLPSLARWVGLNRPGATVLEVGCGPCGLAPWIHCKRRIGIDPLADWFREQGIDYARLGYKAVLATQGERVGEALTEAGVQSAEIDIVLCSNVLDHCEKPMVVLSEIAALGHKDTQLYLAYDERVGMTPLHPQTTDAKWVSASLVDIGWLQQHKIVMLPRFHWSKVTGTQVECWRRHGHEAG